MKQYRAFIKKSMYKLIIGKTSHQYKLFFKENEAYKKILIIFEAKLKRFRNFNQKKIKNDFPSKKSFHPNINTSNTPCIRSKCLFPYYV